jgi:hypothetical protein
VGHEQKKFENPCSKEGYGSERAVLPMMTKEGSRLVKIAPRVYGMQ